MFDIDRRTRLQFIPRVVQAEANLREVALDMQGVVEEEDIQLVRDVANAVQYLMHRILLPAQEYPLPLNGIPGGED